MGVWVCGVLVWVGAGLGEVGEVWVGVAVVPNLAKLQLMVLNGF